MGSITVPQQAGSSAALGRPTRKAAEAVLEAHVAVLKGSPLKSAVSEALKTRPKLGGQERRFIAVACRELSRHQRRLDTIAKDSGHSLSGWALREDQALIRYVLWRRVSTGIPWVQLNAEVKLPGPLRPRTIHDDVLETLAAAGAAMPPEASIDDVAARYSFTSWMTQRLELVAPNGELEPLMAALNREPSLILRARPPGSRAQRIAELERDGIHAEALVQAPDALTVVDVGTRVFESPPMKKGWLQVQDLGSQLMVEVCRPAVDRDFPGATIADVCAGAGGKTLALADRVGQGGRVFALDRSPRRLSEAKKRVSQAHLSQVSFDTSARLGDADVILVDAPCSGSGNLSREPDLKWKLNAATIREYAERQIEILDRVIGQARVGAVVVYGTCSLFREENEDVVAAVIAKRTDLELDPVSPFVETEALRSGPFLRVWPHRVQGGGFFAARLRRVR